MICISDFINSLSPHDTIIRPLEIEKANKRGAFICITLQIDGGKFFSPMHVAKSFEGDGHRNHFSPDDIHTYTYASRVNSLLISIQCFN